MAKLFAGDVDTIRVPGIYTVDFNSASDAELPAAGSGHPLTGVLIMLNRILGAGSLEYGMQIWFRVDVPTAALFYRKLTVGTWTKWYQIAATAI